MFLQSYNSYNFKEIVYRKQLNLQTTLHNVTNLYNNWFVSMILSHSR